MSEVHVYPSGRIKWTDELNGFMRETIPGHTYDEIRNSFFDRYGIVLSNSAIVCRIKTLGVKCGVNGGTFAHRQSKPKQRKPPHPLDVPYKLRPLMQERVNQNDMVEVHVSNRRMRKRDDTWMLKSHHVWQRYHGVPVPKGVIIVFADRNNRNFSPENLVAVPRKLWSVINFNHQIPYFDAETLRIAIDIARVKAGIADVMKRPRECKKCGHIFKPRFAKQVKCDSCIGH